ncbi:hypothetical protein PINS_up006976 [Pythium insidiosum]|nr:hypothetical protein PINS_up006976 [Pythium insidiosum]
MATTTPVQIKMERGVWSKEEHDRFLEALQRYPNGPGRRWRSTSARAPCGRCRRTPQKYHEKVARRLRGLRKDRKRIQRPEHRIDDEMLEICQVLKRDRVPVSPRSDNGEASPPSSPNLRKASLPAAFRATKALSRVALKPTTTVVDEIMAVKDESIDAQQAEHDHDSLGHRSDVPSFDECLDFLIEVLSSTEFSSYAWYSSDSDSDSP